MVEAVHQLSQNPRQAAALAVADVLAGHSLSASLPARCSGLEGRDRSFAYDLAFGACRWKLRFDGVLAKVMRKPLRVRDQDVTALLLCGLYQLFYSRVPVHAAVGETARIAATLGKPWATGLVNGVLRRVQRERQALSFELDQNPVTEFALPGWLIDELAATWLQDWRRICAVLNERPIMTLRVNRRKITLAAYLAQLADQGIQAVAVDGMPYAVRLATTVEPSKLPGFDQGQVSVQDAGAQYAAPLLGIRPEHRVLDACAAPGGKSSHLLELCPAIRLTALDVDEQRSLRIVDNLTRLGQRSRVLTGDATRPNEWWDGVPFDRILLDVPCTATGAIRRHPDIRLLRRPADIPSMAARQDAILESVWPLLRSGGSLLYATCSLLSSENDRRVAAFVGRHRDAHAMPLAGSWGISTQFGRQLLPEAQANDGFFYALLIKEGA